MGKDAVNEPINIVAQRYWSRLCAEARRDNRNYTINHEKWTPDTVDPDGARMVHFIMTFYPGDTLEPFE